MDTDASFSLSMAKKACPKTGLAVAKIRRAWRVILSRRFRGAASISDWMG